MLCYYLLALLQACCNCQDPELPYYDYAAITIETQGPETALPEHGFAFILSLDSTINIAQQGQQVPAGLINTAYACDCAGNGAAGAKFGIKAINIYADSVFDAAVPAHQALNHLFEALVQYNPSSGTYDPVPLDSIGQFSQHFNSASHLTLVSQAVPVDPDRPYSFKIEIVKENGSIVSATSRAISWKN